MLSAQAEASGKLAEASEKLVVAGELQAAEQASLLKAEMAIAEGLRSSLDAAEVRVLSHHRIFELGTAGFRA